MTESCALVGAIGDLVIGMQEDRQRIKSLKSELSDLKLELEELQDEVEQMVQLVMTNLRRLASMEALAVKLQQSLDGVQQQASRIVIGTESIAKDTLRITKVMVDQEKKIDYGLCWKGSRHVTHEGLTRLYFYNYHQSEGSDYKYFQTFKEFRRMALWCIDWEQPACTTHTSSMSYMRQQGEKSLMWRIYKNHFKFLYACHHTKVNFRKTCLLYKKQVYPMSAPLNRLAKKPALLGCYIVPNIDIVDTKKAISIPLYESDVIKAVNRSIGVHYPFEAFGCHMEPNNYYPSCNISSILEPY
uniref:Uncharacterized protein n=1 Tax=Romanomermis culicivorax TaxID=13658 RepID=A0A915IES8_ROMCU